MLFNSVIDLIEMSFTMKITIFNSWW
jgi:hypothetical protein